ncbi:MAG TPA: MMPL family transporter [Nocardioides sp.]|nr:MMPL family transporter [Nocardioides sp.]
MFKSVGRVVGHHPVRVILAWVAIVLGIACLAAAVVGNSSSTSQQQTDFLPSKYESVQAAKLAARYFPQPAGAQATLVVTRADHRQLSDADLRTASQLITRLDERADLPKLEGIDPHTVVAAPNRTVAIATAQFTDTSGQADVISSMHDLRSQTRDAFDGSGLRAQYTGEVAQVADAGAVQTLIVFGTVAAIFLLLLVLFRSIVVAVGAVGLMYVVGAVVHMLLAIAAHIWGFKIDETTTSLLPIVLFGVGTDYVVFFMFRYREQLRQGLDHRVAIEKAIGLVGEAVSSSAFAVIVSFAALALSQLKSLRLLGPALGLAVLVMLASSLTLIPAVLALTGKRISRRRSWREAPSARRVSPVASFVSRRPVATLAVTLATFIALGTAALGMQADYRAPNPPSGTESGQAWADVQRAFPKGVLYPTDVYVHANTGQVDASHLRGVREQIEQLPGVGAVAAPAVNGAGDTALFSVELSADPSSPEAVNVIRHQLVPAADRMSDTAQTVQVGGPTMAQSDFQTALARDMRIIFPVAGLLIGLILVLMLRALVAPALLMISVALGFTATLGAAVIAFQGIGSHPGLQGTLPMIVYLFVASIGTDYNILMIARIKEESEAGTSPRDAVRRAICYTGPSVAAAAVVLASSFAILMLSPYVSQVGFAVAAGVLISMWLSSWLYVPALSAVLGHRMWWPSRAGRDLPGTGLAHPAPTREPVGR